MSRFVYLALAAFLAVLHESAAEGCEVRARTSAGWVCGVRRATDAGQHYGSFLAVPYAKQPVGELRFKELQPPEPWTGDLNATQPGPVCPQTDVFYGSLMKPAGMGEECIHANIHVPLEFLPTSQSRPVRDLKPPLVEAEDTIKKEKKNGLPILVFVHGGGFAFGSGDPDLHGPQHLVNSSIIVITFNYRLNVFGFLSLNSRQIPGNNGLRDMITLLRWVRHNAAYFGGNPDDVTIAGQSAGASAVHLLTLSPQAEGLFNKAIIMSGTALPLFYTTSPVYAQFIAKPFLDHLRVNSTDPEEIHRLLTKMPLEDIMEANRILQEMNGLAVFFPVIETPLPGIKAVLPEDTEMLLSKGHGKDIPLLIGYTNRECESFKKRFNEIEIMKRIQNNSLLLVSPTTLFSVPPAVAFERAEKVANRYFNGQPTIEKYLKICTETFFQYPALKLAKYRSKSGGAPAYMYQFSYNASYSPIKQALGLDFDGAGHVEDLTYLFKVNSVPVPVDHRDDHMTQLMNSYVINFINNGHPTCSESHSKPWLAISKDTILYQDIQSSVDQHLSELTPDQIDMVDFFDGIMSRS